MHVRYPTALYLRNVYSFWTTCNMYYSSKLNAIETTAFKPFCKLHGVLLDYEVSHLNNSELFIYKQVNNSDRERNIRS